MQYERKVFLVLACCSVIKIQLRVRKQLNKTAGASSPEGGTELLQQRVLCCDPFVDNHSLPCAMSNEDDIIELDVFSCIWFFMIFFKSYIQPIHSLH